jgi:two-component system, LytTR family, response regulator
MKAILIDDELDSLESLKLDIEAYCPDIYILDICSDPRDGLKSIRQHAPDVVFLDIEMPHMNGFELLESLTSIDFDVIFVTAYDEFAVKAFDFNAADYLLKPVMKTKLMHAVQKVADRQYHQFSQTDLNALMTNMNLHSTYTMENIALPTSDGFEFIHMNEIVYLQSDSNYTWVHLCDQKKHLLTKTLKDMQAMITFPQFFRAHQSYLVNLNHVRKYVRGKGGYLILKDDVQIPVSRANKEALMHILRV